MEIAKNIVSRMGIVDTKVVVESCQHPEAEATGLMDTTLKTYLT